jgi:rhodanese-related sulfurtransferase
MNRIILTILCLGITLNSCKNRSAPAVLAQDVLSSAKDTVKTEVDLLLAQLAKQGDYVNSRQFPSMIKAATVFENLKKNTLVIDLRDPVSYRKGHIPGAKNLEFSKLPSYFENEIKPFQYDKIILDCENGQRSSYATCLLRLLGYGNVFAMRWGMSAWNPSLADDKGWGKMISDKYSSKLDTTTVVHPLKGTFPLLNTGMKSGEEILKKRVHVLFGEDLNKVMLTADQVFEKKDSIFIINYDRKDKYESGHIPGSIRYKPNGTLGIPEEMKTIPVNKQVVLYCETGHNSAFATAYLRLLGYDAHSLKMGGNSFMYEKMKREKALSWNIFTSDQINNFPLEK